MATTEKAAQDERILIKQPCATLIFTSAMLILGGLSHLRRELTIAVPASSAEAWRKGLIVVSLCNEFQVSQNSG